MLVVSLVTVALSFTLSNFSLTAHTIDSGRAFCFAEAGIMRAMYKINNNDTAAENWTFSGSTVNIAIANISADTYNVTSSCAYQTADKSIRATIKKDTTVFLQEWESLN
jgi:Tfp pilus assembly protein PilX